MEAGRIGGGETRAAGRGKVGRSGAPVGRDHQYGGTTKKQKQNRSSEGKVGQGRPPRWSGVTVRGDTPKCGASRWSAMGVRGLTTQNHFGLDRDRPSHGSRDRTSSVTRGVGRRKRLPHVDARAWGRRFRLRTDFFRILREPLHDVEEENLHGGSVRRRKNQPSSPFRGQHFR